MIGEARASVLAERSAGKALKWATRAIRVEYGGRVGDVRILRLDEAREHEFTSRTSRTSQKMTMVVSGAQRGDRGLRQRCASGGAGTGINPF